MISYSDFSPELTKCT